MALIAYLIAFITTAIGYTIALVIQDNLDITKVGGLTQSEIFLLINGFVWFTVCFIVYFGSTKLEEKKFGLISPKFFITWIFVAAGVILGAIIWLVIDGQSVNLDSDFIRSSFFGNLAQAIAPTLAASMGLQDKD